MSSTGCTAEHGCPAVVVAKGYCRKHYTRWKRYGDPLATKFDRASGADDERWMQKLRIESPGCWIWTGEPDEHGYGQYMVTGEDGKRKSKRAHRYIYEQLVGPLDPKDDLDHLCRVHLCCNPDHLEPVSHKTNVLRGYSIQAQNARKERCPQGHPLNGVRATGRYCRTCDNDLSATAYRRRKTACSNGHPYTPETTAVGPTGRRSCLTCAAEQDVLVIEDARRLGIVPPPGLTPEVERMFMLGAIAGMGESRRRRPAGDDEAAVEEIERRRRYQREYMRDRRARERAEKIAAVAQGATQAV